MCYERAVRARARESEGWGGSCRAERTGLAQIRIYSEAIDEQRCTHARTPGSAWHPEGSPCIFPFSSIIIRYLSLFCLHVFLSLRVCACVCVCPRSITVPRSCVASSACPFIANLLAYTHALRHMTWSLALIPHEERKGKKSSSEGYRWCLYPPTPGHPWRLCSTSPHPLLLPPPTAFLIPLSH